MNSADRRERETCHFLALRVSISARKQLTEHRCGRPSSQIGVRSGPKRPDRPFPSAEAEPLQAPLEPCSRPACRTQARAAHLQIPSVNLESFRSNICVPHCQQASKNIESHAVRSVSAYFPTYSQPLFRRSRSQAT